MSSIPASVDTTRTELVITAATSALLGLEVPKELRHVPIAAAMYLEHMGTPGTEFWWPADSSPDEVTNWLARRHSEFSLVATSTLSLVHLFARPSKSDREIEFDVAFLFFAKGLASSAATIQLLTTSRCYADAFAVVRTLHTRVNLLALVALGPHLFDDWLKSPKEPRFRDGRVRGELAHHGIYTFPHMYEQASEVVHAQFTALAETGYMETGLFPRLPAIENRVLASAKFLFGIAGWIGVNVLLSRAGRQPDQDISDHEALFAFLDSDILAPDRIDHLPTSIAEDRHWVAIAKNKMAFGQWFSSEEYRRQLELFQRASQPKRLGKNYRKRSNAVKGGG